MGEGQSMLWKDWDELQRFKGKKLKKKKKEIKKDLRNQKLEELKAAIEEAVTDDGWYNDGEEPEPPLDIGRMDLRVGKYHSTQTHPLAPQTHYVHQADLGQEHFTLLVAELVGHYKDSELEEKRDTVVLVNIKPPKVNGLISYGGATLCAIKDGQIEVLNAPPGSEGGDKIFVDGYPRHPDKPHMKDYKKIPDKILQDLRVNDQKQVVYKGVPLQVQGHEGYITTNTLMDCLFKMNIDPPEEIINKNISTEKVKEPIREKTSFDHNKDKNLPPIDIGWLDLKVVRVLDIEYHRWDDNSYVTYLDIGEPVARVCVCRLVPYYYPRELDDKKFIAICNINYINKSGISITARLLSAAPFGKRELLKPPHRCEPGDIVRVEGYTRKLYSPLLALHKFNHPAKQPKRKIFTAVAPDLWVNSNKVATFRNIPLEVKGKGNVRTKFLSDCRIR